MPQEDTEGSPTNDYLLTALASEAVKARLTENHLETESQPHHRTTTQQQRNRQQTIDPKSSHFFHDPPPPPPRDPDRLEVRVHCRSRRGGRPRTTTYYPLPWWLLLAAAALATFAAPGLSAAAKGGGGFRCDSKSQMTSALACLPETYSKFDLPTTGVVIIYVTIDIDEVLRINDKDYSITFSCYFNVKWTDPRIHIDPEFGREQAGPGINTTGNPDIQFDPGVALDLIDDAELGLTHLFAVPAPYQFMMQHPKFETTDFSRIVMAGVGGAPCAEATARVSSMGLNSTTSGNDQPKDRRLTS